MARLRSEYGDIIPSSEAARCVIAYCDLNIRNHSFSPTTPDNMDILLAFAEGYRLQEDITRINSETEKNDFDDPEWGLTVKKPIYVHGIHNEREYIEQLKTNSGEKLTWKRRGSISIKEVAGAIDIYESTLPSGEPYKTLYLNMYYNSRPRGIPKGFSR